MVVFRRHRNNARLSFHQNFSLRILYIFSSGIIKSRKIFDMYNTWNRPSRAIDVSRISGHIFPAEQRSLIISVRKFNLLPRPTFHHSEEPRQTEGESTKKIVQWEKVYGDGQEWTCGPRTIVGVVGSNRSRVFPIRVFCNVVLFTIYCFFGIMFEIMMSTLRCVRSIRVLFLIMSG